MDRRRPARPFRPLRRPPRNRQGPHGRAGCGGTPPGCRNAPALLPGHPRARTCMRPLPAPGRRPPGGRQPEGPVSHHGWGDPPPHGLRRPGPRRPDRVRPRSRRAPSLVSPVVPARALSPSGLTGGSTQSARRAHAPIGKPASGRRAMVCWAGRRGHRGHRRSDDQTRTSRTRPTIWWLSTWPSKHTAAGWSPSPANVTSGTAPSVSFAGS